MFISQQMQITVHVLAGLYGLLALLPSIQFFRIYQRAPNLGMTSQKWFLVLTLAESFVRMGFFIVVPFHAQGGKFFQANIKNYPLFTIWSRLPNMIFFTTYTLLILFWAEIINHARNQSLVDSRRLRFSFALVNIFAYLAQVALWVCMYFLPLDLKELVMADNIFNGVVALLAALGFVFYGGRLFFMLQKIKIDSPARTSKLHEVGWVTIVCCAAFVVRAGLLVYFTFDISMDDQYYMVAVYFCLTEIVPSFCVLYILRKLPPQHRQQRPQRRTKQPQQRIPGNKRVARSMDTGYPMNSNEGSSLLPSGSPTGRPPSAARSLGTPGGFHPGSVDSARFHSPSTPPPNNT